MKFNDYVQFFAAIKDRDVSQYTTLTFFVNAVKNIDGGCSCNKSRRIETARSRYTTLLTNLTEAEKQYLQTTIAPEIEFYNESQFLGRI